MRGYWAPVMAVVRIISGLVTRENHEINFVHQLLRARLLYGEGRQDVRVLHVHRRIVLPPGEEGGHAAGTDDKTAAVLVAVASHVAAQVQGLGLGLGRAGYLGEDRGEQLEEGEAFEAELGEGFLVLVEKEFAVEELALEKLLQTERLQADPYQPDVVAGELGQKSRDLFGRQPAEGSAESSQKDDHTRLLLP